MQPDSSSSSLGVAALLVGALAAPLPAQVWEVRDHLITPPGAPTAHVGFGETLVAADFDADGIDELVIGAPHAPVLDWSGAGRVVVLGWNAAGVVDRTLLQSNGAHDDARFGAALAIGDFDGNGRPDLAIGAPGGNVLANPTVVGAGKVHVYRTDLAGALSAHSIWHQDSPGVLGVAEPSDQFGAALAAGDFDGDGYDDLAIGVPWEGIDADLDRGAVHVLRGGPAGLHADHDQLWYRNGGGLAGPTGNDLMGSALAAGDFDGDGRDDLALGAPRGGPSAASDGSVSVLYGTPTSGLDGGRQHVLTRTLLGHPCVELCGSFFGETLAAGDLDRDAWCDDGQFCADDLVIGAPNAFVAPDVWTRSGLAYVVLGDPWHGLDPSLAAFAVSQAVVAPDAATPPEENDQFGSALAIGASAPRRGAALAIGAWAEDLEGLSATGGVHLVHGLEPAFDAVDHPDAQYWSARTGLAAAPAAADARFGRALAHGDFDGDGAADLAIGVPGHDLPGAIRSGAVQILYGALFADGFERGAAAAWSRP